MKKKDKLAAEKLAQAQKDLLDAFGRPLAADPAQRAADYESRMNPQQSLFKKEEGIKQVTKTAGNWFDVAIPLVLAGMSRFPDGCLVEMGRQHAIENGCPEPHHANAWGALATKMRKAGLIQHTGRWGRSGSVKAHARAAGVWRVV